MTAMFSKNAISSNGSVPANVSKRLTTYIPDRRQNINPIENDTKHKIPTERKIQLVKMLPSNRECLGYKNFGRDE